MTESAIVPMSTNDVWAWSSSRNCAITPIDSTPTNGQKTSSKKKKRLRDAITKVLTAKAQTATSSARQRSSAGQLNEDLLQLRLADADVTHDDPLGEDRAQ